MYGGGLAVYVLTPRGPIILVLRCDTSRSNGLPKCLVGLADSPISSTGGFYFSGSL